MGIVAKVAWKSPYFVNYSDFLVAQRFSRLSFRHTDDCRCSIEAVCGQVEHAAQTVCGGCSFSRPYPLTQRMKHEIVTHSSMRTRHAYAT